MAQLVLVARRSTVSRAAGLLGGAAVALSLVGRRGDLGLGITFAAPGFAVCALTGVLVGELLAILRPPGQGQPCWKSERHRTTYRVR